MCLMAVGGIISGVVSAVGTMASAAAQSASYKAQAQYAQRQSILEQQKGALEANQQARANDRRLSGMRSAYLSSGIDLAGSAADVIEESATEASMDEQAIKFGAQIRSDNYAFESRLARTNASNAMAGGAIGALGSVVNGFTQQSSFNQQRTMIRNPYQG
ncbi:hypothetical protein [Nitratireductor basaltis]|uniref:Internal virion protein B n=1 Tax=Nitratireductor basaltis TaxID=472175 RepID=A0A084UDJ2_9HYPH|nr:hypothetical protein [Nitratireductor basaltis]KFB11028.1 hypothetical protein EL18_02070 [Nitratireductor basaltis]